MFLENWQMAWKRRRSKQRFCEYTRPWYYCRRIYFLLLT